jgi:HTH-type transcriptional regulator/antitoxin HigA
VSKEPRTTQHPGKILRQKLDEKGWTQEELASITGRNVKSIGNIVTGKAGISADMAVTLAAAFGNAPEDWLTWDSQYALSLVEIDPTDVDRRARIFAVAPIREMQKRGWISDSMDTDSLERELTSFFGKNPLNVEVALPVAARKSNPLAGLSPSEKAWCFRALWLARRVAVAPFAPEKFDRAEAKLRQVAAASKEARHVPRILAECGVRFLVIEPLVGKKMDGATLWLNETEPVIAMSLKDDRIDNFWFTLMHEWSHVRHGDASVDSELTDGVKGVVVHLMNDDIENRANLDASDRLIPTGELTSFIRRVGPLYSRERIIQFANRQRIHPGIVAGQLQFRKDLGYHTLRDLLTKVKETVISTALTDGWNQSIAPKAY